MFCSILQYARYATLRNVIVCVCLYVYFCNYVHVCVRAYICIHVRLGVHTYGTYKQYVYVYIYIYTCHIETCTRISIHQSINPSIYIINNIYLSTYLPTDRSTYLPTYLPTYLTNYLPTYRPNDRSTNYLSI